MNMSFVSSLNETPYALTFAGQATPWRAALDEIAHDPEIAAIVAGVIKASDKVLSPVRRSLATQSVSVLPFTLPAPDGEVAVTREVAGPDEAALSVPGIVAAQLGALIDLTRAGLNIMSNQPTAFEGHSQGVLGVEIARALTPCPLPRTRCRSRCATTPTRTWSRVHRMTWLPWLPPSSAWPPPIRQRTTLTSTAVAR